MDILTVLQNILSEIDFAMDSIGELNFEEQHSKKVDKALDNLESARTIFSDLEEYYSQFEEEDEE